MTVGEFLKGITKFAEKTPDTLVYFDCTKEDDYYLYVKSIRAIDGYVYLECKDRYNDSTPGYVYHDAHVLVHLLSKMDPSSELKIDQGFGDDEDEDLIDVEIGSIGYDGESEICINFPIEWYMDEDEDWDEDWEEDEDDKEE